MFPALLSVALASDPGTPHPTPPRLTPITSAPAAVTLTAAEKGKLAQGGVVQRQSRGSDGGSGVAVQYIFAPADAVWDAILDYDRYPDRVDNVVSCSVYRRSGSDWYVDMQSSVLGFRFGLYTVNHIHRQQGYMAWELDYTRTSDVGDMIGYWRVEAVQTDPPITRLDYSTEMLISGVPDALVRYLTSKSLTSGTAWVKQVAEGG
jgi:ribosome-associated toxin RatA of RatAB toxin-antitoxin module